jgi:hypothetical protein
MCLPPSVILGCVRWHGPCAQASKGREEPVLAREPPSCCPPPHTHHPAAPQPVLPAPSAPLQAMFMFAQLVFGNQSARLFTFVYLSVIHLLVFSLLLRMTHHSSNQLYAHQQVGTRLACQVAAPGSVRPGHARVPAPAFPVLHARWRAVGSNMQEVEACACHAAPASAGATLAPAMSSPLHQQSGRSTTGKPLEHLLMPPPPRVPPFPAVLFLAGPCRLSWTTAIKSQKQCTTTTQGSPGCRDMAPFMCLHASW